MQTRTERAGLRILGASQNGAGSHCIKNWARLSAASETSTEKLEGDNDFSRTNRIDQPVCGRVR